MLPRTTFHAPGLARRAALVLQRALCWSQDTWVLSWLPRGPAGWPYKSLLPEPQFPALLESEHLKLFQHWLLVENHKM